jgi:hypothetical protein
MKRTAGKSFMSELKLRPPYAAPFFRMLFGRIDGWRSPLICTTHPLGSALGLW